MITTSCKTGGFVATLAEHVPIVTVLAGSFAHMTVDSDVVIFAVVNIGEGSVLFDTCGHRS